MIDDPLRAYPRSMADVLGEHGLGLVVAAGVPPSGATVARPGESLDATRARAWDEHRRARVHPVDVTTTRRAAPCSSTP